MTDAGSGPTTATSEALSESDALRVLYVGDGSTLRERTRTGLERANEQFEVVTEPDARAGLERLAAETIDCVVSGYELPGRDGLSFLEAVRDRHGDLPFVLYTAGGSETVASRAISAGVTEYVRREPGTGQYALLTDRVRSAVENTRTGPRASGGEDDVASLLAETPDAVAVVSDGTLEYVNAAGAGLLGTDDDEGLVGREFVATVDPADRTDVERVVTDVETDRTGPTERLRWRVDTGDGEERHVEGNLRGIEWRGDRATLVAARDVTERIGAERERIAEAQKYEQILEQLDTVVWLSDAEFEDTLYMNGALKDWYGLTPEELEADEGAYLESMHPDDREGEVEMSMEIYEAANDDDREVEDVYTSEFRVIVDGEIRWLKEKTFPIRDEDGTVVRWAGIEHDITPEKREGRRLEEMKLRYEQVLEQLESVVYLTDGLFDEVLYVNGAYEDVFDRPVEALYEDSMDYQEVVHPDDVEADDEQVETVYRVASNDDVEPEDRYPDEYRLLLPDGEVRWIEEVIFPVQDGDGEILRWAGVATDVTERKRREQELERLNDRLEFQNRILSVMNRVLRHDLRNKMVVIKGAAETLMTGSEGDNPLAESLLDTADELLTRAEKARRIDQLSGSDGRSKTDVDVASIVEDHTSTVAEAYPDAEVTVAVEETAVVRADPLVDVALENVIDNAAEHNDADDPRVDVSATRTRREGTAYLEVAVADNGPGIPELERTVLEQDQETQVAHSVGLGLWLTNWVMELSDGVLEIDDREPRGTVVRLCFPLASDDEDTDGTAGAQSTGELPAGPESPVEGSPTTDAPTTETPAVTEPPALPEAGIAPTGGRGEQRESPGGTVASPGEWNGHVENGHVLRMLREMADVVYALDADGRISFVDDSGASYLGRRKADLLGKPGVRFVSEPSARRIWRAIDRLRETDATVSVEHVEAVTPTGDRIPCENLGLVLSDDQGRYRGYLGVLREVDANADGGNWFERTVDPGFVGIVAIDGRGRIERTNRGFAESLGRTASEVVGASLRELCEDGLVDERAPERYEAAIGELLSPGTDRERAEIEFDASPAHRRSSTRYEGYVGLRSAVDGTFDGGVLVVFEASDRDGETA